MRPLQLKLEGFGPFGGTEQVDFSALSGVFLITGDTGAGKTTIFDGICYALFGETSGSARQVDSLRSQYAGAEQPTQVTLRFLQHEKIYEIRRSPRYERPRKSGKGMTEELPKVALTLPDGTVLTGKEAVGRKVEELLGLNYKQFKQVAMLAQGEFLQLLLAGSDQRGAIFRKVFHTEDCQRLQAALKELVAESRARLERIRTRLDAYLQTVKIYQEDSDAQKLRDLLTQKDLYGLPDFLPGLQNWIRLAEERREQLETLDRKAQEEIESCRMLKTRWDHVQDLEAQCLATARTIELQEKEKERAQKILETADAQEESIQNCTQQLQILSDQLKAREEADALQARCESIGQKQSAAQKQYHTLSERMKASAQEADQLQKRLLELREVSEQYAAATAEVKECRRAQQLWEECARLTEELSLQQKRYLKAEEAFHRAREASDAAESQWLRSQAGIMAASLTDGEPCPVCGSREHPAKAHFVDGEPLDEGKRKELREKMERCRKKCVEESNEAASLQSRKQLQQKNLEQLDIDTEQIPSRLAQAQARLAELERQTMEKKGLEERELRYRKEQEAWQAEEAELRSSCESYAVELASCMGTKEHLEECCQGVLKPELEKRIREKENERKRLSENLRQAREDYERLNSALQQARGRYTSLSETVEKEKKTLRDQESPDGLADKIAAMEQRRREYKTELSLRLGQLQANQEAYAHLSQGWKEYGQAGEEYQKRLQLSQTASGELAGRPKLAFEQYIQAFYFEHVLDAANQRLTVLSRGQYALMRRTQANNLRSADGLEIEVLDHYTGKKRPVSSLSGGESFQAAMSLALGLSDVVQRFAGGIEVDAVFIDEGFGSLDQEALNKALETLSSLSEGDRLVGVISHVEALKERIPQQLVVRKGLQGSRILQGSPIGT